MTNRLRTLVTLVALALLPVVAPAQEGSLNLEGLRTLAEEGGPREQCDYAIGCELAGDDAEALLWYRKAAEQGLPDAQYRMGVAYAEGQGVEQDAEQALEWFRKAADQGSPDAQYQLGLAHVEGADVPLDHEEAVRWFWKGAQQRHPPSQCGLGWMYLEGAGVPQNHAQAYLWLNLATSQLAGEERELCEERRDEAADLLTPEQRSEAQKAALDFHTGTKEEPEARVDEPEVTAGPDPEDLAAAAHERQLELESLRHRNQLNLQRQQLRELRRLQRYRRRVPSRRRRGRYY